MTAVTFGTQYMRTKFHEKSFPNIDPMCLESTDLAHFITVTSHEPHGVASHRQGRYLNSLYMLGTKKTRWGQQCGTRFYVMMKSSNGNIFPPYWPFVRGIHRPPVNSPQKGQWRGALMFPLICAWINGWVNNREAGDLRRHRAHYDITVMSRRHFLTRYRVDTTDDINSEYRLFVRTGTIGEDDVTIP